jgi:diaminopimelate epimerase
MQKSKKIALIILGSLVGLLLIYTLAGFLGVPYALKNTLPAKLKDINASLSVADAKFNPFTFELNVTRPELNTTAPLFSAEQIDVKFKPFSLFNKLAEVDILRLESPSVNIARDKNGTLNLAAFLGESNATSTENNETSSINFALNSTKIIGGSFAYSDESLKQPFSAKFEGINYEISGINTEQNSAGKHVFDANSTLAQKLDWQGGIDLAPLRVYGELSLKDFNVRPVALSFIETQDLRINSALINAKMSYELSEDGGVIKAGLKNAALNLKSFEAQLDGQNLSLEELDLPAIKISADVSEKRSFAADISEIKFKNTSFKGEAQANLNRLNLSGVALKADINEKGDINASAALKALGVSGINLTEKSVGEIKLKDANASELDAKIKGQNIAASLKNLTLNVASAPVGKNSAASLEKLIVNAPKFTLENNASAASIGEVKVQKIALKTKNKELATIAEIGVKDADFDLAKTALRIESININKPKFATDIKENGELSAISELGLNGEKTAAKTKAKSKTENAKKPAKSQKTAEKTAAKKSQKAEQKSAQSTKRGFQFSVKNVSVTGADIGVTHIFEGQKIAHKFDGLNVNLQNISENLAAPVTAKIDMKSSQKLNLALKGKITPEPLSIEADIKLNDANLPRYFVYAKNYLDANLKSGELNAELNVKYAADATVSGKANIANIELADGSGDKVFAFKNLKLSKISFAKNFLNLERVTLSAPFLKAHLNKERELNLSSLVKKSESEKAQKADAKQVAPKNEKPVEAAKPQKKEGEFDFAIKNILVENGDVDFSDASLFMPFATKITKLEGVLMDIDSARPTMGTFEGVVGKSGFSKIGLKLLPYDPKKSTEVKFSFKDIDLVDITPYSGQFLGYKIEKGKLNLTLNYDVKDSKLNGSNVVNLDTLTLGEKVESKDAVNLPLSLAISILSDQNNQINIDLPVTGDLNDPDFKYGGIVWEAVKKLFADITLAPFRFLGNMLGLSSKDLNTIDFMPANAELIVSEQAKIADFIKLTTAKPKMKLSITPAYSDVDVTALKNAILNEKISQTMNQTGKDYAGALASLAPKEKSSDEKALREAALKGIEVKKEQLLELANARAQAIKAALAQAGLTEDRMIVKKPEKTDVKQGEYSSVMMGVAD